MKSSRFNLFLVILLVASVFHSCTKSEKTGKAIYGSNVEFGLPTISSAHADTKTMYETNNSLKVCWADDDKVRIFCDQSSGAKAANYKLLFHAGQLAALTPVDAAQQIQWNTSGIHNFYSAYPIDPDKFVSQESGVFTFKAQQNQVCSVTPINNKMYSLQPDMNNAYMVASLGFSASSSLAGSMVPLVFNPIMTTLEVVIVGGTAPVTVTGVSATFDNSAKYIAADNTFKYDVNSTSKCKLLPSTGVTPATYSVSSNINSTDGLVINPGDSASFILFIPPVEITAASQLTLKANIKGVATPRETVLATDIQPGAKRRVIVTGL